MSVNMKKRGRPSADKVKLNQQQIIECAKSMMQESGKLPSIRQLASNLGVDAMAIYHYFANKNALLEAMTISLIENLYQPINGPDWQQELEQLCVSYLGLLSQYSGLLETLLSMSSDGPARVFNDKLSTIFSGLNLPADQEQHTRDLLVDYLHGFALAMRCHNEQHTQPLDSSMIKGPLQLIIRSTSSNGA
ncbi:TetR/AcrR family transcriptional regulator [Vibrio paucivorans]|uniref:TetR/AcrR family transcriptional regulator n=1 Tax=Vibrio paucivorans TaxID=2829489 RepID=A0A9X3CI21_9VIBR|nr:TetR/AcrR family transcriptional regulator [Vibrio paucivorans]MCW8336288.1 TetR/AcrR family transcriptional regulator [Vibrio paucivorans]